MIANIARIGFSISLIIPAVFALRASQAPAPAGQPPPSSQAPARPADVDHPGADFLKRPPVTRLTPEVQQQLFLLPEGYTAELVLADPDIQDPVGVTFDGNGRMYVLEMRSYMRDLEGSNSREPISRISRWEDINGDGTYDRHTVFADKLVLPRIAFPLEDGVVLVLETDNRDLFKFTDTNGDGVADKKEVFYSGYGRVTNMEWQPGGMVWALDNWLYTTYNPFRLRLAPDGRVLREETDVNGGQWGVAQDNYGKLWFVDGGTERGPVNFQAPILYGAFNVADQFEPGFEVPWPAGGGIGDMQGGIARVRLPDGTLNHFTAAAGPEIFRGHRLPQDMLGDLLFTEPVGRIVRRAKVMVTQGLTQLRNAYHKSEFIRSTDPLFRPVNVSNTPDGTIYISDMYTGIIQDAQFIPAGSYLRRKIAQYDLDTQHNWGRIWRIRHSSVEPDRTPPRMYSETAVQLMSHLNHPSGWWRDTAQKLLVLRHDKSIVPTLKTMARAASNQLGRIHALWTLEGLGALDPALLRSLMKDSDAQIRIQAIRASESLYKATPGDRTFAADYRALTKDPDPNVVLQALLTINLHRLPQYEELIRRTTEVSPLRGIKDIGTQLLQPVSALGQPASNDPGMGYLNLAPEDRATLLRGESTYKELCFSCHGADGKGTPLAGAPAGTLMAPPLAGSPPVLGHRDYVIEVLLHGLSGPINGKEYSGGVMVPMGGNTDEWIADIANYIRNAFGNSARPYVTPEQVAAVRRSTTRRTPWTYQELLATIPQPLTNASSWIFTASHRTELAANASGVTPGARWDTGGPQQSGMWLQIELPEPATLVEIQLDSSTTGRANPGLGGFGGLGGTTTPPPTAASAPPRAGGPASGGAPGRGGGGRAIGNVRSSGGRGVRGAGPSGTGPAAYRAQLSIDGKQWSAPVAEGKGETPTTVIMFRATLAKFVRITQTDTADRPWIVQQARIYHVP